MATSNRLRAALSVIIVAACGLGRASVAHATVYSGNGATGFGGPVGTGALTVTDDALGNVTFAFQPGVGHPSVDGNNLVIYLSTGATGLVDTSPLTDNGDSGREGISGYSANTANPPSTRSLIAFPSGFQATYALAIQGGFVGLFQLPPANGDGGLTYVTGAGQSGNPLTVTFPLASIGLNQGQSFRLLGTLIDGTSAYRSNETIGATSPNVGAGSNPGFNNLITFSSDFTYNSTVVPEPASFAAFALGGAFIARGRRTKVD